MHGYSHDAPWAPGSPSAAKEAEKHEEKTEEKKEEQTAEAKKDEAAKAGEKGMM